jgi:hypothetical protein
MNDWPWWCVFMWYAGITLVTVALAALLFRNL